MALPILRCPIEEIAGQHPPLFLEPHIVACAAVLSRYSPSPATIEVECTGIDSDVLGAHLGCSLEVAWRQETAAQGARLRLTVQSPRIVEMAAVALGFALISHLVAIGQVDVTRPGDRADYRSLDVPAVLEMSGTETASALGRRHTEKMKQALDNPFGDDAYVVVCAFSS